VPSFYLALEDVTLLLRGRKRTRSLDPRQSPPAESQPTSEPANEPTV
jgi:hypothetical protein